MNSTNNDESSEEIDPNYFENVMDSCFINSFRRPADSDYIMARIAYRLRLTNQAIWCGGQALEKYLKCILTLNRISVKKYKDHKLDKLFVKFESMVKGLDFNNPDLYTSKGVDEFVKKKIGKYGSNVRYSDIPYIIDIDFLEMLDQSVWEIRRLARQMPACCGRNIEMKQKIHKAILNQIAAARDQSVEKYKIKGGLLEQIISDNDHPAKYALIWQNKYYNPSGFIPNKTPFFSEMGSSLLRHPSEVLLEIEKYMDVPYPKDKDKDKRTIKG